MPIGDKRSEGKWLIQVQRVLGKWEGDTSTKNQAWRSDRRQLTSRIGRCKYSTLAGMFRLVLYTLEAESGNY